MGMWDVRMITVFNSTGINVTLSLETHTHTLDVGEASPEMSGCEVLRLLGKGEESSPYRISNEGVLLPSPYVSWLLVHNSFYFPCDRFLNRMKFPISSLGWCLSTIMAHQLWKSWPIIFVRYTL